jgi:hypothetical protein
MTPLRREEEKTMKTGERSVSGSSWPAFASLIGLAALAASSFGVGTTWYLGRHTRLQAGSRSGCVYLIIHRQRQPYHAADTRYFLETGRRSDWDLAPRSPWSFQFGVATDDGTWGLQSREWHDRFQGESAARGELPLWIPLVLCVMVYARKRCIAAWRAVSFRQACLT